MARVAPLTLAKLRGPRLWAREVTLFERAPGYGSNGVRTSKYTLASFVPRSLLEQFRRVANFYFLIISLLQLTTRLSPTNKYSTIGPLLLVLVATMAKEAVEDKARHDADAKVNRTRTMALRNGAFASIAWQDVVVGDVLRVSEHEWVPADAVLLLTSEPEQIAHVGTANLDGETSLKVKTCPSYGDIVLERTEHLRSVAGVVRTEAPHESLYTFEGEIAMTDKASPSSAATTSLHMDNVVLRGTKLVNTEWVICVVVYTGRDTKLLLSTKAAPSKFSRVDAIANRCILLMFLLLVLAVTLSAAGTVYYEAALHQHTYLQGSSPTSFVTAWVTYLILYNNLVPISLYISLEVVKWHQARRMERDPNLTIDGVPTHVRTTNLNEDVGQVSYVFSDKTGTLTKNEMAFRICSIHGAIYDDASTPVPRRQKPNSIAANWVHQTHDDLLERGSALEPVQDFFRCLLLCHTASAAQSVMRSTSPDEVALLNACPRFNCAFEGRSHNTLRIRIFGKREEYSLLSLHEFDSDRKCMSVVVQRNKLFDDQDQLLTPCSKKSLAPIVVYVKGADASMLPSSHDSLLSLHVHYFACMGLRTLVFGQKILTPSAFTAYKFNKAKDEASALRHLEANVDLLGATGIEDRLQDGVKACVRKLADAGIHLWMLTGDKDETAVAIGHACGLIPPSARLLVLDKRTKQDCLDQITHMRYVLKKDGLWAPHKPNAQLSLVLNGVALDTLASYTDGPTALMDLVSQCGSVIACRLSPSQKAEIVAMVKASPKAPVTLAIGDGGNDVTMIQEAHIGVGIAGHEGRMQAVRAADIGVGQFRCLSHLILLHGRWNYLRVTNLITFTFYKNAVLIGSLLWFSCSCGWSGQTLYDSYLMVGWNVAYTLLPLLVLGIFDQDLQAWIVWQAPRILQCLPPFGVKQILCTLLNALYHATLLVLLTMPSVLGTSLDTGGLFLLGTRFYGILIVTVTLKGLSLMHPMYRFTRWHIAALVVGVLAYVAFVQVYARLYRVWPNDVFADLYGLASPARDEQPLLRLLLYPVLTLLLDATARVFQVLVAPTNADILAELEVAPRGRRMPGTVASDRWRTQDTTGFMLQRCETFRKLELSPLDKVLQQLARLQREASIANGRSDPMLQKESDLQQGYDPATIPMHPLTMVFFKHPDLEAEYHRGFVARERSRLRVVLLWVVGLLVPYAVLEYYSSSGSPSRLGLRLALLVAALLFVVYTRCRLFALHYHGCLALVLASMALLLSATVATTGVFAATIFPIVLFAVVRIKFVYAVATALLHFAAYAYWTPAQLSWFGAYLVFVAGFAANGSWRTQRAMRRDFLQNRFLLHEEARALRILDHMLPRHVMRKLEASEPVISEAEPSVTVLFCDVVDFGQLLEEHPPPHVVQLLDHIYSLFDELCFKYSVQKVETVGKTYMACAGLQEHKLSTPPVTPHALRAACLATEMLERLRACHFDEHDHGLRLRIGLHSGRVITGLVGKKKQQFSLFGDTVNTASRMQSSSKPGQIRVSEATYASLTPHFEATSEKLLIKGKGVMDTFILGDPASDAARALLSIIGRSMDETDMLLQLSVVEWLQYVFLPMAIAQADEDAMQSHVHSVWLTFHDAEMEAIYLRKVMGKQATAMRWTLSVLSLYMLYAVVRDVGRSSGSDDTAALISMRLIYLVAAATTVGLLTYYHVQLNFTTSTTARRHQVLLVLSLLLALAVLGGPQFPTLDAPLVFEIVHLDWLFVAFVASSSGLLLHEFTLLLNGLVLGAQVLLLLVYSSDILRHANPLLFSSFGVVANVVVSRGLEFFRRRHVWLQTRTEVETAKADHLLYQRLPQRVVSKLKTGESVCETHHEVGILFSDIQGFTSLASKAQTEQVIQILDSLFAAFDVLTETHGVFKMQTIGDAYVIVSGLPYPDMGLSTTVPSWVHTCAKRRMSLADIRQLNQELASSCEPTAVRTVAEPLHHLQRLIEMGLAMQREVAKIFDPTSGDRLQMRIGIHAGSIVGGVIGTTTLRYDMWGPDVLLANALEASGIPGGLVVSSAVRDALTSHDVPMTYHKTIQKHVEIYAVRAETRKEDWVVSLHESDLRKAKPKSLTDDRRFSN
ncbi:hypothetical protein SDRG_00602 [Saprolegnia diclina VS20]|uniref:P-type phospholipid transporter n=1 Tax=Saprolegnia diclina (strain VS20) TaxID=1156394 RepID=T0QXB4_SAPDV|nr:hypothetical protein SDRG_00602 [Saprolegnia diclina VS20]EQC42884.1 hypothetical protein SDRG_00602 [Saprolegnia diclina VS20]|eukprot:XP_008604307.1 hypothetical protein SDRG_00602 [Saprolegnia diclina VS20]